MKKTIITLGMVAGGIVLLGPAVGFAQTGASTTVQAQLEIIAQLTKQIQALQAQIEALRAQAVQLDVQRNDAVQLIKTLNKGTRSEEVKTLQILLAADPELYPEKLITGFYGALTEKAVKKFQAKYDIVGENGRVSEKTLKKVNELLEDIKIEEDDDEDEDEHEDEDEDNDEDGDKDRGKKSGIRGCAIIPPGHLIAKGWLKENEAPVILPCQIIPKDILEKWRNATSTPPTATSTDTTAPIISGLMSMDITHTSAAIHWVTNEMADSEVRYGTSSAYGLTTATSTKVNTHHIVLNGLTPSTTYHYTVQSKDAAGNVATSSNQLFTTLATPDTTAPVISGITASNIASTTATIGWTTNEAATSKVYYGGTTPLNLSTATATENIALVTSHSLNLTGLNASSTYYAVVESKDGAGNAATSIEKIIVTLP